MSRRGESLISEGVEILDVDSRGRLVLKKRLRELVGIKELPGKILAIPRDGYIELRPVSQNLSRAKEIAKKKLVNWVEERRAGEKLLIGGST